MTPADDNPFVWENTSGEFMRFTNSKVGIGTTSPYKHLEVAGDIQLDATNANMWLKSGAAGTNGFINWTFNTDSTVFNKIGMDYDTRASTGFHIDAGYPITIDATASGGKAINFSSNGTNRAYFDSSGHLIPGANNTYNLGSSATRWANIYTNDLNLSNEGTGGNDIDESEGNWTIQEGETDLFIINNKNGKKYKFSLEEL